MKVKILSSASKDLIEGYRFYEKQAEGIGEYFLDSLFADIDSQIVNAGIYPVQFKKYHRLLAVKTMLSLMLPAAAPVR